MASLPTGKMNWIRAECRVDTARPTLHLAELQRCIGLHVGGWLGRCLLAALFACCIWCMPGPRQWERSRRRKRCACSTASPESALLCTHDASSVFVAMYNNKLLKFDCEHNLISPEAATGAEGCSVMPSKRVAGLSRNADDAMQASVVRACEALREAAKVRAALLIILICL